MRANEDACGIHGADAGARSFDGLPGGSRRDRGRGRIRAVVRGVSRGRRPGRRFGRRLHVAAAARLSRRRSIRCVRPEAVSSRPTPTSGSSSKTDCPARRCPGGPTSRRPRSKTRLPTSRASRASSERVRAPEPMDFGSDPGGGAAALEAGAQAYLALECQACHGPTGRGNGTSAPTLEDWRGFPVRAADLTEAWSFNGGTSVADIHTRVLTGLDGTPMPSAIDAMNAGVVSPDEVWQLSHYVASLGPREMPPIRDVVRVGRAEGALPVDGSDGIWGDVEAFFFPLAGQVIQTPRNFAPRRGRPLGAGAPRRQRRRSPTAVERPVAQPRPSVGRVDDQASGHPRRRRCGSAGRRQSGSTAGTGPGRLLHPVSLRDAGGDGAPLFLDGRQLEIRSIYGPGTRTTA